MPSQVKPTAAKAKPSAKSVSSTEAQQNAAKQHILLPFHKHAVRRHQSCSSGAAETKALEHVDLRLCEGAGYGDDSGHGKGNGHCEPPGIHGSHLSENFNKDLQLSGASETCIGNSVEGQRPSTQKLLSATPPSRPCHTVPRSQTGSAAQWMLPLGSGLVFANRDSDDDDNG